MTLVDAIAGLSSNRSSDADGTDVEDVDERSFHPHLLAKLESNLSREKAKKMGTPEDPRSVAAAISLQRAYRLSSYVYRHFGPELFVDSTGNSSGGRVMFEGVPEPAHWINVASTTSVPRLTRFMDHYWKMPKPEVIITVTGGAQDFQLTRQQQVAFDRGLVSAAQSAKAWIFTAGSDTGVMRLVGNALAKYNVDLPVVGVFPWGVVNERELLADASNTSHTTAYRPTPATIDGAPLNPHHSHFVFVDDGKKGRAAWGSEIQLRSALEAAISKAKGIPIVRWWFRAGRARSRPSSPQRWRASLSWCWPTPAGLRPRCTPTATEASRPWSRASRSSRTS